MQFITLTFAALTGASAVMGAMVPKHHCPVYSPKEPYFVTTINKASGYELKAHTTFDILSEQADGPCTLVAHLEPNHPKLEQSAWPYVDAFLNGEKIGQFQHAEGTYTDTVIATVPCEANMKFDFLVQKWGGYGTLSFTQEEDSGIFLKVGECFVPPGTAPASN